MGTFLLLVPAKETLVSEELVELPPTHVRQKTLLFLPDVALRFTSFLFP